MKADMTLGQYVEGESLIHRLDPRIKIVAAILYIVAIFLAKSVTAFLLLVAVTAVLIGLSGLSIRLLLQSMKPLLLIILFTAVLNIFWMTGEKPLFTFWIIKVYPEGVINAVLIIVRIVLLIMTTTVFLTYTTTPLALTDALEELLSPLKKLHVPVHEFSMMMTIALRFIPTLIDETEKIINAQTARGADFKSGGIVRQAKAMVPILIPLFVSAFRRADELATAMECRCYTGGEGRTRMNRLHSAPKDWAALCFVILVGVAVVLLNRFFPIYLLKL